MANGRVTGGGGGIAVHRLAELRTGWRCEVEASTFGIGLDVEVHHGVQRKAQPLSVLSDQLRMVARKDAQVISSQIAASNAQLVWQPHFAKKRENTTQAYICIYIYIYTACLAHH